MIGNFHITANLIEKDAYYLRNLFHEEPVKCKDRWYEWNLFSWSIHIMPVLEIPLSRWNCLLRLTCGFSLTVSTIILSFLSFLIVLVFTYFFTGIPILWKLLTTSTYVQCDGELRSGNCFCSNLFELLPLNTDYFHHKWISYHRVIYCELYVDTMME